MITLNNILSVARSAITAQQTAVQVASNNIANANTEGYSRQRVVMQPNQPIQTALGPAATGVRVAAYERMRDPLLDISFRRDEGKAAAGSTRRDLLRQIEGVYGEPSEHGLGATMDAFWAAWDDLANDPLSDSARGMVRQRAMQVTTGLNNAAALTLSQEVETNRQVLRQAMGAGSEYVRTLYGRQGGEAMTLYSAEPQKSERESSHGGVLVDRRA